MSVKNDLLELTYKLLLQSHLYTFFVIVYTTLNCDVFPAYVYHSIVSEQFDFGLF